jgi:predicted ester cyclase
LHSSWGESGGDCRAFAARSRAIALRSPDWNERVDDLVAEGDRVAIRITSTGTQLGEFEGLKPTGRKITIQEFHIFRLSGGKIVEQWGMPDVQGLMAQLSAPGQK